jgi:hypothetical protein
MAGVLLTMRAAWACPVDRKARANSENVSIQPLRVSGTGKALPLSGNLWPALNALFCRSFLRVKEFARWTCLP